MMLLCHGEAANPLKLHPTSISYVLFGWGASKSTTQGGIFDLLLYVTFDCAGFAAFRKHRWNAHVQAY